MKKSLTYALLIGGFLLYSFVSVFTKQASLHPFLSWGYVLSLGAAVIILGLYAILWQQVLKRMEVSDAYMFKGLSVIFILVLAWIFYGETITLTNGIGAAIIVGGIALHAKS